MEISVVIPAYNEEKRIENTLEEISNYFSKKYPLHNYEIIVVNDGSTDGTKEVVNNLKEKIYGLKFIDNKINRGKGAVVRQGMLSAKGNHCLFVDADNAIKINHFEKFFDCLQYCDLVIGSIECPGAKKSQGYIGFNRFYRNLLGKLSKYLIRALTIWEIKDTQRAFKLFKKDVAEEIFSRQTINGWGFDIELLVIAKKLGYKIKELPVEWINPPGRVKFSSFLFTLKELFQIKTNSIKGNYV